MKIMLIEPDMQLGRIYAKALQRVGHQVHWQRNAQESIDVADKVHPEAVILEVQLARHNGIEFLYEFRSYPDWQQVPVILHTNAIELPADERLLARLGVQAILYKPQTTLATLIATVERLRDTALV